MILQHGIIELIIKGYLWLFLHNYIENIPQIFKLIKTKSSNDYSLGMILLQFIVLTLWGLYVFTSKQDFIVYIGTIIDYLLLIYVDILILNYYNFKIK